MVDLPSVQNEKMVHVNDRDIPIMEDMLQASEILERAGFVPSEFELRIPERGKRVKENEKVRIENNMRLDAILKPT